MKDLDADTLHEDDIRAWWRSGGHLANTGDLVTARGFARFDCAPPSTDEIRAARGRIAAQINADRRIAAGIAGLSADARPATGWESRVMDRIAARIRRRERTVTVLIALAAIMVVALAVWL